jgi:CRISPR-associated endonuclease/helicase Cas3
VRIYPDDAERAELDDLRHEETRPRYRLIRAANRDDALARAHASDAAGPPRSTLWVVNTVRRCQELAKQLRRPDGSLPLVYHSRFTPRDRRERHRAVIEAFQAGGMASASMPRPWAITTQVCEMSLDLDADRLASEDAPLTAIIQRLGRACRKRTSSDPADIAAGSARHPDFRAEILLYPGEDARPYSLDGEDGARQVAGAARFAQDHDGRELGQQQLTEALNNDRRYAPAQAVPEPAAGFISGGWFAVAQPLRGEDDVRDVRCVLTTDLERGLRSTGMPDFPDDPLDAWIISVPRRHVLTDEPPAWMARLGLHLADGRRYSSELGFDLTE